ncbi:ubiquinone biosynthesis protein UbiE [Rhodococcus sp. SRB_17]|nr:ubiquinone biosynthesis protein UbiE [Rhodococcus sp. SRB_17]
MEHPPASTPGQFKAATRDAWESAAQGWDAQTPHIHRWLADATEAMLAAAQVQPGARVLDVAAGAGDQTLAIARRVGPGGQVLATDISPAILALAERQAVNAGLGQVQTKVADAEHLDLAGADFDAAICRLGLMFCPDPLAALREMHAALKPGGHACTLVFAPPQDNPCMALVAGTALRHARQPPRDPYQPGTLFSLGKPGLIDALFAQAGFTGVRTTAVPAVFRLPSSAAFLDFIRTSAAPIRQLLAPLDADARAAAWHDMQTQLDVFQGANGWEGPNTLLLTVGRRAPD